MDDIVYVNLTWQKIDEYCLKIAELIKKSPIIPNVIISIGRGGMIPARILSDILSIPTVYMYNIKLYTGVNKRQQKPTVESFAHNIEGKDVLLVDDIMDSGATIESVLHDIRTIKRVHTVRTATLLCKKNNKMKPTFYASDSEENEWIIFSWEKNEFKR